MANGDNSNRQVAHALAYFSHASDASTEQSLQCDFLLLAQRVASIECGHVCGQCGRGAGCSHTHEHERYM